MSAWSLLAIPLCLGGIVMLLAGMSWFEQRLLSPRSLIVYTARSRHVGPDTVEVLVTAQSEELLRGRGLLGITTTAVPAPTEAVTSAGEVVVSSGASEAVAAAVAAQAAPATTRP